jgi:RHS repeat-associated protein
MTRLRAFGASAGRLRGRACGASARHARLRLLLLVAALGLAARPAAAQTEIVEYYGHDALGSIRIVFTASGAATARADYEPFGEAVTIAGMPAGPLPAQQFTGQERDALERQDYFGARYYRPRHGRFSQVDPVYAGLFDPQQWNRYAYARNNPLSFVDPDGRKTREAYSCAYILSINKNDTPCTSGGGATMPGMGAAFGVPPSLAPGGPGPPGPRRERQPGDRPCAGCATYEEIEAIQEAAGEVNGNVTDTTEAVIDAVQNITTGGLKGLALTGIQQAAIVVLPEGTTARTFRKNLQTMTGSSGQGHHAHHVFPKAFEDRFRDLLGIDVNRFGAWWEAHAHLKNAHQYNEAWRRFLNENPTTAGAFELARRLMRRR